MLSVSTSRFLVPVAWAPLFTPFFVCAWCVCNCVSQTSAPAAQPETSYRPLYWRVFGPLEPSEADSLQSHLLSEANVPSTSEEPAERDATESNDQQSVGQSTGQVDLNDGTSAGWQLVEEEVDGNIKLPAGNPGQVFLLAAKFTCDAPPLSRRHYFGYATPITVWLDGEKRLFDPRQGTFEPFKQTLMVDHSDESQVDVLVRLEYPASSEDKALLSHSSGFELRGVATWRPNLRPAASQPVLVSGGQKKLRSTTNRSGEFSLLCLPYDRDLTVVVGNESPDYRLPRNNAEIVQFGRLSIHFDIELSPQVVPSLEVEELDIPDGLYTGIAESPQGLVYLFEKQSGTVYCWTPGSCEPHPNKSLHGIAKGEEAKLYCGENGAIWIATETRGVFHFLDGRVEHFSAEQTGEGLLAVQIDNSDNSAFASYRSKPDLVTCLFPLGTSEEKPSETWVQEVPLPFTVTAMTDSPSGVVMVSAEGHRIRVDTQTVVMVSAVSEDIRGVASEANGSLWFAGEKLSYHQLGTDALTEITLDYRTGERRSLVAVRDAVWGIVGERVFLLRAERGTPGGSEFLCRDDGGPFQAVASKDGCLYAATGRYGVRRICQSKSLAFSAPVCGDVTLIVSHRGGVLISSAVSSPSFVNRSHSMRPVEIQSLVRSVIDKSKLPERFTLVSTVPGSPIEPEVENELVGVLAFESLGLEASPTSVPVYRLGETGWQTVKGPLGNGEERVFRFCQVLSDGRVIVATDTGVFEIDELDSFESDLLQNSQPLRVLHEEGDGVFWFADDAPGQVYRQGADGLASVKLGDGSDANITCLQSAEDTLWIGSDSGMFACSLTETPKTAARVEADAEVSEGVITGLVARLTPSRVLVATHDRGLHRYAVGVGSQRVQLEELKHTIIRQLYLDVFGRLWIATDRFLVQYNETGIRPILVVDRAVVRGRETLFPKSLSVNAGDDLTLQVSARDELEGVRFEYRNGAGQWQAVGSRGPVGEIRLAATDDLSDVIEFRCLDSGLNYSEVVSIPLNIVVPYYRTAEFFYLLSAAACLLTVLIGGLAYSAVRFRHQRSELQSAVKQEEERNADALKQIAEERELLLARVSHDLQNPISVVLYANEALGLPDPDVNLIRHCLDESSQAMRYMTELLLRYAKINSNEFTLSEEDVDVRTLLTAMAGSATLRLRNRPIEFDTEFEESSPRILHTDRQLITEVLNNFTDNAFRHTYSGSIKVRYFLHDGEPAFEVIDTGEGMSPEMIEGIFRPFVSGYRDVGHVGLGLYICQRIVERLGGSIQVESAVGQGTTVRLTLPKSLAVVRADDMLLNLHSGRVLVADDDALFRKCAANYLQALGSEVLQVEDVVDWEAVKRFTPDAAFLDLIHGSIDTEKLAQDLKEHFPGIKVWAVSTSELLLDEAKPSPYFDRAIAKVNFFRMRMSAETSSEDAPQPAS